MTGRGLVPTPQGMRFSTILRMARDGLAAAIVAAFVFPLFWWGLPSIKPGHAILDPHRIVALDFVPTWENYAVTLAGAGPASFDSRASLANTAIVALMSTAIALAAALPLGFALSVFTFRYRRGVFYCVLFQRALPPIAIVFPLVLTYHAVGLRDTMLGVALAHAALNLPFAVLLLKSFYDDVPPEVIEAATIDGASRLQVFARIATPMIRGGVAATAVLCMIFSWAEFLMSLFLTSQIRMFPVQASIVVTNMWGYTSALSTAAMLPAFVFILLVQRHLVRSLTLGMTKG